MSARWAAAFTTCQIAFDVNQHSSSLSFIADAYLNEMGITNRLRPKDVTTVLKTTSEQERSGYAS